MDILLVGFDDEMAAAIMKLLPMFINPLFIERKNYPEKIGNNKPEIAVFNLTARLKTLGFKIRPFVDIINRENSRGDPIPFQIYVVSDSAGEEDAKHMLDQKKGIKQFFLLSDTVDFGGLEVVRSIIEVHYDIKKLRERSGK